MKFIKPSALLLLLWAGVTWGHEVLPVVTVNFRMNAAPLRVKVFMPVETFQAGLDTLPGKGTNTPSRVLSREAARSLFTATTSLRSTEPRRVLPPTVARLWVGGDELSGAQTLASPDSEDEVIVELTYPINPRKEDFSMDWACFPGRFPRYRPDGGHIHAAHAHADEEDASGETCPDGHEHCGEEEPTLWRVNASFRGVRRPSRISFTPDQPVLQYSAATGRTVLLRHKALDATADEE